MAENKQYITQAQENGAVMISEEVIATIVVNSLKDVKGVAGIGGRLGFDLASIKNWGKALRITITENNNVCIDCNVIVAYGQSVIEIAKAAQDAVGESVANITGLKPAAVNINVCGIARQ